MTDDRWFAGHLHELDEAECWELVRSREVGRIAYTDDRGPMVVPVTYVVGEKSVLFRVAPYTELARYLPDTRVALEVDESTTSPAAAGTWWYGAGSTR